MIPRTAGISSYLMDLLRCYRLFRPLNVLSRQLVHSGPIARPASAYKNTNNSVGIQSTVNTRIRHANSKASKAPQKKKQIHEETSTERPIENAYKKYQTYDDLIAAELERANRTLLVWVGEESDLKKINKPNLSKWLSANILDVTRYRIPHAGGNFLVSLVEFASRREIDRLMTSDKSGFFFNKSQVPIPSRSVTLAIINDKSSMTNDPNAKQVYEFWKEGNESSLSELIQSNNMTHSALKLKFFTISILNELLCSGVFANFELVPFGSSVSGLGNDHSDLDLVMVPKRVMTGDDDHENRAAAAFRFNSRLIHAKGRDESKYVLHIVADMAECYVPHVKQLQRILQARVPILKFLYEMTGTEIDLSVEINRWALAPGIDMARVQYALSTMDPRFRPLTILLKIWSKKHNMNLHSVGLTSFHFLNLLIHYLQQCSPPVLPPLKTLIHPQRNEPPFKTHNTKSLEQLLMGFFQYYANFDFVRHGVSTYTGQLIGVKPKPCSVYIENPIERDLNAATAVHEGSLATFKVKCRTAFYNFEANGGSHADISAIVCGTFGSEPDEKRKEPVKMTHVKEKLDLKDLFSETEETKETSENER